MAIMKRFVLFTGVLIGIIAWASFSPVFAGSGKIGVIDIQKVMRESATAKDARGMFLLDVEAKRGVLRSKEKEIRAMEIDLETNRESLSPEAFQEGKENLERAIKDLRRLRDDMEEELQKKEGELRKRLMDEIRDVVKGFLKENKYAVILENKTVLAWDDAVDVTGEVTALYDAQKYGQ
jgi:outer membrane protein